jgi:hypothetical protein
MMLLRRMLRCLCHLNVPPFFVMQRGRYHLRGFSGGSKSVHHSDPLLGCHSGPGLAGGWHAGRRHRYRPEWALDRPVGSILSLEIRLGKQNASAAHLVLWGLGMVLPLRRISDLVGAARRSRLPDHPLRSPEGPRRASEPARWRKTWRNPSYITRAETRGFLQPERTALERDTAPRGIGGVLATVHEITEKTVGERRIAALRDLGVRVAEGKTAKEACSLAALALQSHGKTFRSR